MLWPSGAGSLAIWRRKARRDEKVVGAAVLLDGAGTQAQRAAERIAERLRHVAIEHGRALGVDQNDVLPVEGVRDLKIIEELRCGAAAVERIEVADVGRGSYTEAWHECAVLRVVDVADADFLLVAAIVEQAVVAGGGVPLDVVELPIQGAARTSCRRSSQHRPPGRRTGSGVRRAACCRCRCRTADARS